MSNEKIKKELHNFFIDTFGFEQKDNDTYILKVDGESMFKIDMRKTNLKMFRHYTHGWFKVYSKPVCNIEIIRFKVYCKSYIDACLEGGKNV